jgi:phosphatidylglycerophosphate synthase
MVRAGIRHVAAGLQRLTHGRVRPDAITLTGALAHLPIAWLIAVGLNAWAAALLVIFGLFDTLDGELARLQGRSSARGMLLDASTDRLKETALYTGAAYTLATGGHPATAALAAAACGASLSVSYVKAKGEAAAALGSPMLSAEVLNRLFKDGLLTFELRMVLLFIGLLTNQLALILALIALLAGLTAVQRLVTIRKRLAA